MRCCEPRGIGAPCGLGGGALRTTFPRLGLVLSVVVAVFLTAKPVKNSFSSQGQTLREEYDCEETVTKSVYGSIKDYCSVANEDETGDEEVGNDGESTAECLLLSTHTEQLVRTDYMVGFASSGGERDLQIEVARASLAASQAEKKKGMIKVTVRVKHVQATLDGWAEGEESNLCLNNNNSDCWLPIFFCLPGLVRRTRPFLKKMGI